MNLVHIGIDARYIYPDHVHGIGRFSHSLIQALAQIDSQTAYTLFKRKDYTKSLVNQNNFTELLCKYSPISFGTLLHLPSLIKQQELTIFHSLFPVAPLWSTTKRVVTVHDLQAVQTRGFSSKRHPLLDWGASLFYHFSYKTSITHAHRIIADSEATRHDIIITYGIPAHKIDIIYGSVNAGFSPNQDTSILEHAKATYHLPPRYLLNVGNTRPHKNVEGLLRGYAHYCRLADKPLPLVLVGFRDRFFLEIEVFVQTLALSDQVLFLGYIPDEHLAPLYKAAELFVTASSKEGFGLPVLESMACGTPVLVSNAGSLPEIVGKEGILIDPYNAEEIGAMLNRILRTPSLLEKMKYDGLNRARFFSWEKAAKQTLSLYQQLV